MLKRCATKQAWLRARHKGIGASEAAALFGCTNWGSPYSLWLEKTNPIKMQDELDKFSYIHWGALHEPTIAAEFKRITGFPVTNPGKYAIHWHENKFMFATLDRLTEDADGPAILECKFVKWGGNKWGEVDDAGFGDPSGVPLPYQVQTQQQMACAKINRTYIAALIQGDDFRMYVTERNDRFIAELERKCLEFREYILTKTPPPIDGSEATERAIREYFPVDDGERVFLADRFIDLDREREEVIAESKLLDAKRRAIDNEIKAAMGDAAYAELPECVYSYKAQTMPEHVVKESTFRVLRRSEK